MRRLFHLLVCAASAAAIAMFAVIMAMRVAYPHLQAPAVG
jgi:hypothetical protein